MVSWQTLGIYRSRPAVRFGTNKRDLYRQRRGSTHTYPLYLTLICFCTPISHPAVFLNVPYLSFDRCMRYGTAYFHDVVLKNLRPGREYFYTIVGDVSGKVYSFNTAPRIDSDKPFVATILGDIHQYPVSLYHSHLVTIFYLTFKTYGVHQRWRHAQISD